MAAISFDSTVIPEETSLEPVPEGTYVVVITDSDWKPTKNGEGGFLEFVLEVQDPENFKGRKIWDRMNLYNKNEVAVDMAQRRLKSYCDATGVQRIDDTVQLHGIPFSVRVAVRKQEGYNPTNDVKEVKSLQQQQPSFATPQQPQGTTSPPQQQPPFTPPQRTPQTQVHQASSPQVGVGNQGGQTTAAPQWLAGGNQNSPAPAPQPQAASNLPPKPPWER